ncbi:ImpA family type VI secretion system protein [Burkholderia ubonensis]|uniref:Type VI secretion protein ImpA n=1 Tax=Burkholderia ubonensis TaxID=101571 RepID=A0A1R1JIJ3_9BURK|nr:type VI secretion system ImpA family N-terminal domain-containing protein [Burkholderia ubonensis]OMG75184.1 type VI secretion protein ImpA [Burkholderia ubonensis]
MGNSKKSTSQRQSTGKEPPGTVTVHDWMEPIGGTSPCGADLEYDPEFVVLCTKIASRPDAQYGDFVGSPEPVSWNDVDRDCRRLMMRSKDMRFAVIFTRCRTRLAAAAGFAEGVGLLAAWLAAFPDVIHPQMAVDSDREAALQIRMNALQALTDTDGLLSDVREIVLATATATRLQVRDIERAFAHPRPSDALTPESVTQQLDELRARQPAVLSGFDRGLESLGSIDAWSREHLGAHAPDLSPLTRLLRHVVDVNDRRVGTPAQRMVDDLPSDDASRCDATDVPVALPADDATGRAAAARGLRTDTEPADRDAALERIREACRWFEQHEPSSPVPVLLRRAEQFVGKRYAEVVKALPAELLAQWESEW